MLYFILFLIGNEFLFKRVVLLLLNHSLLLLPSFVGVLCLVSALSSIAIVLMRNRALVALLI